MLVTGQEIDLTIDSVAYRGSGVARHEGLVVFVPDVAPREHIRVRIVRLRKNYAEGSLIAVLDPSPDRIAHNCCLPNGTPVPGCVYDHLTYPAEVQLKQTQAHEIFRRLPGAESASWLSPVASPRALHYRNKIVLHAQSQLHRQSVSLGYIGEDNRTVVDIPSCPLAHDEINGTLRVWRESGACDKMHTGDSLTLRWTAADGVVAWINNPPPHPPHLTETTPIGPIHVPLDGFYQVNPEVADALVRQVMEWHALYSGQNTHVLDLYCGVGVLGFACAQSGSKRLSGIESGRDAIQVARQNAKHLGIEADFRCQLMTAAAQNRFGGMNPARTTVIVDPPRQGMDPTVVTTLATLRPSLLIYVSCDPVTLARDLKPLVQAGYRLQHARLFDMFPRTAHFETAVCLTVKD